MECYFNNYKLVIYVKSIEITFFYLIVNTPVIRQNVISIAGWSGTVTRYANAPAARIPTTKSILDIWRLFLILEARMLTGSAATQPDNKYEELANPAIWSEYPLAHKSCSTSRIWIPDGQIGQTGPACIIFVWRSNLIVGLRHTLTWRALRAEDSSSMLTEWVY